MTTNRGIAPADTTTHTGLFRLYTNDLSYVALDPAETGFGDYTHSSDQEIAGFLVRGRDSVSRALGEYYLYLASQAALTESKAVKDFDLQIDGRTTYKALMETAAEWFARADLDDEFSGTADIFDSFGYGGDNDRRMPIMYYGLNPYPDFYPVVAPVI